MITTTKRIDADDRHVELQDGARAVAVRDDRTGHESLRVFSASQQLLFEYDEQTGTTRVHIPSGDLEFVAQSGSIRFAAADGVQLESGRSSVAVDPSQTQITSPQFDVAAQSINTHARETNITSQQITTRANHTRLIADTLEIVAGTMIETAKSIFQRVTELWQLQTKRLKASSESSATMTGETVTIKSDKDVKIKGEQIHLG